MKYFYAVIHCNSPQTADKLYSEYNGYEFEQSNLRLNLSFIPDSLTFPQEVKETATEVPADYVFKTPGQLNRALNHTHVRLTWDETDPKRLRKFQKIMQRDADDDDEAYREFIASHSESEQEEEDDDRDKIEEYRQKLLGGLSSTKVEDDDSGQEQLDVKFNVGFGEDIGKRVAKEKKEREEQEEEGAWEKYQRRKKEKKREKKEKLRELKEKRKNAVDDEEEDGVDSKKKKQAELELLVGKKNNGMLSGEFKANVRDARFEAVLKDKSFAIDPTHKNF